MEVLRKADVYSIVRYDKDDYVSNLDVMNNQMFRVLASHEKSSFDVEEAKQYIQDKNTDFFMDLLLDAKMYVMYSNEENMPVGFALFSHDPEREDWHLEYICTHKDYSGFGYAEGLLKVCAKDLATTEYKEISSVVNKSNAASLAMHDRFAETTKVELRREWIDENRIAYQFDISKLDKTALSKDIEELIY